MTKTSLTRQLIGAVLLAEILCAALFSAVAVMHEMHGRRRAFDVMLRGRADSLLGAVQDAEDPEDNVRVDPTELALPKQDVYEVLSPSGRVVGQSPGLSAVAIQALARSQKDGYFDYKLQGEHYRGIRFEGIRIIDREDNGGLRRPVTVLYASPTRNLWHEAMEAVQFYVIAGVLLLAITAVLLVWFLRRKLSPLQELAGIAGRVTEHSWDFAPPQEVLQTAELAPIAHSIEKLLDGLHQAFLRQRRLTGDAAHEWKTSIAVLKSSLQLLSMRPRAAEQYRAGLQDMLLDVERMEDLASRMLALARLEETAFSSGDSSDLKSALETVVGRLRPLVEAKQVEVRVTTEGPAIVALSPDDSETLCSNLILNAVQHTNLSGHVSASLEKSNNLLRFKVVDDGEGIPQTALPHVFERFYRADRSRSRNSGGAGLGLAICKAMVETAKGSIQIRSTVGQGTEVVVTLPITDGSAAQTNPKAAPEPQAHFSGKS